MGPSIVRFSPYTKYSVLFCIQSIIMKYNIYYLFKTYNVFFLFAFTDSVSWLKCVKMTNLSVLWDNLRNQWCFKYFLKSQHPKIVAP